MCPHGCRSHVTGRFDGSNTPARESPRRALPSSKRSLGSRQPRTSAKSGGGSQPSLKMLQRAMRTNRSINPCLSSHAVLSEVLNATAEERGGRLIKTMGDGALYEFASPVQAVACAIAVQEIVNERASGQPMDRRVLLRIGINLGDVVEGEGGDLFGDGVNVAARLEGIADPGGLQSRARSTTSYRASLTLRSKTWAISTLRT